MSEVISYYSMFYIANAVLFKIGYKIGEQTPHKITADALIVFVRNKLKKNFFSEQKRFSLKWKNCWKVYEMLL